MKHLWIILVVSGCLFTACNNSQKYDIKNNDQYEKGKSSVEDIEKKNPGRFLTVSGSDKKNLLGQTVVKGSIFNNAKIVHYKDIELKLSFYSQTGTLLEEDQQVIYETVSPGGSASFKTKYFAPKGTDSVAMKVMSAKY
jgi:hypothetical protein